MTKRFLTWLLTAAAVISLTAAMGTLLLGRPFLAAVIRSNSMYPRYQRGDIAFVGGRPAQIAPGTIVLYKPSSGRLAGQWTMHRVVAVLPDGTFSTKGDAGTVTDQQDGLAGPVTRDQIGGVALQLGSIPVKIPFVGHLPLAAEAAHFRLNRNVLICAMVILIGITVLEFMRPAGRRTRRRREANDPRATYGLIGMILSALLITLTLYQTSRITLAYEVAKTQGVVAGQALGIMTPGQVVTRDLSTVTNRGFFPVLLLVTNRNPDVSVDCGLAWLRPGESRDLKITVTASALGKYVSPIDISVLFPLLPPGLVALCAKLGHWCGALAGCLVPGTFVTIIGFAQPAGRRLTARQWRRLATRVRSMLPL